MSNLRNSLVDYLSMRRALGYKMDKAERLLGQFVTFAEDRGENHVRTETALAWADLPCGADVIWTSRRLADVRLFARHMQTLDPMTEVPPRDLLPARGRRATPYLYTAQEIADLMRATEILRGSHVQATYRTLIGLLAVSGMRIGEAIGLDRDDFDAGSGMVTIRHGKFDKARALPLHPSTIERVLAIPPKRFERRLVTYLSEAEIKALLATPNRTTWTGRRDMALFGLAVQTGLRASELIGLRCSDVHLGSGAHVGCNGKGRKERVTPLTSNTVAVLRAWLAERAGQPGDPLFPTQSGRTLSRDALERRLAGYVEDATAVCPSLACKRVTLHVLRHSAAMRLLQAGIDTSVIALWLGHEQIETTQIYLHADLGIKERALAKTAPIETKPGRFQPSDKLLAFLDAL